MTEHTPLEDDLLSFSSVASALSISERQAKRIIAEGALPAVKLGMRTLVRRGALNAYVASLPRATRRAA